MLLIRKLALLSPIRGRDSGSLPTYSGQMLPSMEMKANLFYWNRYTETNLFNRNRYTVLQIFEIEEFGYRVICTCMHLHLKPWFGTKLYQFQKLIFYTIDMLPKFLWSVCCKTIMTSLRSNVTFALFHHFLITCNLHNTVKTQKHTTKHRNEALSNLIHNVLITLQF